MGKTYHDNPRLLGELLQSDFIRKLEPLFKMGWYICPEDGKLSLMPGAHGIDPNTNWIHTNPDPNRPCRWYQLIFQNCDFIPTRCMSCWKVVVRPRSLFELLKLYELQTELVEKNPTCWCKCGWEERPWTHGNYGGYFYNDSRAIGEQRLDQVRDAVNRNISRDIDVFLKRYCTEMEIKYGDSLKYKRPDSADVMETAIIEGSYIERLSDPQPQYLRDHIMSKWILNAYAVGDSSALYYNEGKHIYPQVRKYPGIKEAING